MTCRVVNATITDAFQDMKVSFFTNHSEAQPIYLHTKPEIDGGRRRGWFSSALNSVVNTVTDAVDTVVDVASFTVTLGRFTKVMDPFPSKLQHPTIHSQRSRFSWHCFGNIFRLHEPWYQHQHRHLFVFGAVLFR